MAVLQSVGTMEPVRWARGKRYARARGSPLWPHIPTRRCTGLHNGRSHGLTGCRGDDGAGSLRPGRGHASGQHPL